MKPASTSVPAAWLSVVIPTLNGGDRLRELLAALSIQTVPPGEVIVIDSASSDHTVEVAQEYGAEVISIGRSEFDHGGTRNLGARNAAGTILVYFTQDALPAHRRVLEYLVQPLSENPQVSLCYGRQLAEFEAGEAARHLRLFNYPEQPYLRTLEDRRKYGLGTAFASNSCAAYRKDRLAAVGHFPDDLIFGEDTCAAGRLLLAGDAIAYCAEATVYHSHDYRWSEEFRRYFDVGVLHTMQSWLLQEFGGAGGRGLDYLRSGLHYLRRRRKYSLIGDFMVRTALKYLGYQLGRHYRLLPAIIRPSLSLNRPWWKRADRR